MSKRKALEDFEWDVQKGDIVLFNLMPCGTYTGYCWGKPDVRVEGIGNIYKQRRQIYIESLDFVIGNLDPNQFQNYNEGVPPVFLGLDIRRKDLRGMAVTDYEILKRFELKTEFPKRVNPARTPNFKNLLNLIFMH